MKIGLIFGREFSEPSGIPHYVFELAKNLSKKHEIHLLIADKEFNYPGLTIHRNLLSKLPWLKIYSKIPYLRSLLHINHVTVRVIFNAIYNPFFSEKIKNKFRLDLIHSQDADSPSADVVTMHGCLKELRRVKDNLQEPNSFRKIARKVLFFPYTNIYLFTEKHILKNSKKIIAVSQNLKEEILKNYRILKDKIVVIPNGVDLYRFKPDPLKRAKIRNRYNIDEDEVVLIFVGNAFILKGLDYIMDAISRMKKVKLFIVGEHYTINLYKKNTIKAGIQNKVIFLGTVFQGIEDFYAASDIFLLPSAYEGFPLTSLEAAAAGLPIISTKIGGLNEFVKEGINGFFVRRDSEEIREKIQILVQNKNLRIQMGKNARKTAKKYSWYEVGKKTLQVYEEVIRNT